MLNIIEDKLNEIKLGESQHYRNMSIFPLFTSGQSKLEYEMLRKALNHEYLKITEISETGSVPELKIYNTSEYHILLLDGQELEGAKQNRVLNTTILVYPESELSVPVSCTEQGRWASISASFRDSDKIMFGRAREKKMSHVHQSLKYGEGYRSNQQEVWQDISTLQRKRKASSATSAMKDIFDSEKGNLDNFLNNFKPIEEQCGIIVGLGGKVAGFEYLSSSDCYLEVHNQLVASYTMDALDEAFPGMMQELPIEESQRFMEHLWSATQDTYPSVAAGNDIRLESDFLIGSALVEKEELIHLSAFSRQIGKKHYPNRIAGYRHRNQGKNS